MTREKSIFAMEYYKLHYALTTEAVEAFDMAIEALEQEPCDDAISRQATIDAIFAEPLYKLGMKKRYAEEAVPAIFEKIKALPPVTPQYTDTEIQKMQDLEFAEIQKAYEIGKDEGSEVLDKIRAEIESNMESIIGKYDSSIPKSNMPSYKIERNKVRKECISIIDKYKAESEGK